MACLFKLSPQSIEKKKDRCLAAPYVAASSRTEIPKMFAESRLAPRRWGFRV